jgi:uncharacterized membrane protein YccC
MGGHEYRIPAASIKTRTTTPRLAARPSASANSPSAGVVIKDVTDQRNGQLRRFYRGQHGRKGFVAVDQRLTRFLAVSGSATTRLTTRAISFRCSVPHTRARRGLAESVDRCSMHAEPQRPAADAVDSQNEVEQRTDRRHQPNEGDPKRCGAGITLVQAGRAPRPAARPTHGTPPPGVARTRRSWRASPSRYVPLRHSFDLMAKVRHLD